MQGIDCKKLLKELQTKFRKRTVKAVKKKAIQKHRLLNAWKQLEI